MVTHPPTTRQIADACGCNQSTVSHALRDNPKISQEKRDHIRATAEKMGWRPNPLASAYMAHLRSVRPPGHQANLAFLIANRTSSQISAQGGHLQRHYKGALQRANQLGYALEVIWLHQPHLTARRLNTILLNRNVSGLIIPAITDPSEIFEQLNWHQFAAVGLGFSLRSPELHRVGVHTLHGFDEVLRKMVELGYRRIAIVVSQSYDERVNRGLLSPTYYAQKHLSFGSYLQTYIFPEPTDQVKPSIEAWLREHKPDIVLGEDIVWRVIREMHWRVPQDVAFASVDAAPDFPHIGGFNQRHELHGSVAVDMVIGQLLQNERGIPTVPRSILIEGSWIDGISAPAKENIPKLERSANI